MSIIKDTFFGGAEKKAAKAQTKALEQGQAYTREATNQAKGDLFKLLPAAQENLQGGFQGALDVFGQSLPAQMQSFQQGNVGAQQQILAGLPMMQNALLGNAIDYSQLQPYEAQQPDLGFFQQQLPEFVDPYAPTAPIVNTPQQNFINPLAGFGTSAGNYATVGDYIGSGNDGGYGASSGAGGYGSYGGTGSYGGNGGANSIFGGGFSVPQSKR